MSIAQGSAANQKIMLAELPLPSRRMQLVEQGFEYDTVLWLRKKPTIVFIDELIRRMKDGSGKIDSC